MRCKYCGSSISEHDHRCHHCGRWIGGSPPVYPIATSAAVPALAPEAPPAEVERTQSGRPMRQGTLFAAERPKVIPFESVTAGRIARDRMVRARRQSPSATQSGTAQRTAQQNLDFRPRAQQQQTAHIEAPVAAPQVRFKAAVADAVLMVAGLGLAGITFRVMGGSFLVTKQTAMFYGVAVAAMLLFYQLFWCVLGKETAGMQLFQLRLVTFDGSAPGWRVRVLRFGATCLGLVAAGMGLVWALVDEEKLTWQDHISKTFPMVYDPNPGTFHRR